MALYDVLVEVPGQPGMYEVQRVHLTDQQAKALRQQVQQQGTKAKPSVTPARQRRPYMTAKRKADLEALVRKELLEAQLTGD